MAYPTPPTLKPFATSDVPNLMVNGPYDQQLTAITNYLAQLGQYVDDQISTVRGEIPSADDFATTEQLEGVSSAATKAASDAAAAKETATQASSSASSASEKAQEASTTASNALQNANTANAAIGNWSEDSGMLSGVTISKVVKSLSTAAIDAPNKINAEKDGVETLHVSSIINFNGEFTPNLFNVFVSLIANLMLAAPNDEQGQLLGYLGDNSESLANTTPKVRSSAALTVAAESGSGGPSKSPSDTDLTSSDLAAMKKTTDGFAYVG